MTSIIIKEIKQGFRNRKRFFMMTAFPLLLILILGTVFDSQFSKGIDDLGGRIVITASAEDRRIPPLNIMADELQAAGFSVEMRSKNDKSARKTEDIILNIEKSEEKPELFLTTENSIAAKKAVSIIQAVIRRVNIISSSENKLTAGWEKHQRIELPESGPTAIDYFGVTMLTLFAMNAINSGLYRFKEEDEDGTADRIMISGLNPLQFFYAKIIGLLAVSMVQIAVVVFVSSTFMGVSFGNYLRPVLLIVLTELMMCISVGTFIGLSSKNTETAGSVISVIIPIICFLGGGYYPLEKIGSELLISASVISPLKWINEAIIELIHQGHSHKTIIAAAVNMTIAAAAGAAATVSFRRRYKNA